MTDERLTTAAPELLQALRLATEYIRQLSPPLPGSPADFLHSVDADVRRMVLTKALAAILAATGEAE